MKFMISCRQPLVFLKEAQEIRVDYKDIERLKDFITEDWECKAEIVIYLSNNELINWDEINIYQNLLNIVIATENTKEIQMIKEKGYKVFWSYPVSTYQELRSVLELNVDQVLLDGPLYFDLPKVKNICGEKVELRAVVNKCFNNNLPQKNGICGTYIRPEDIEEYSRFISHFEFDSEYSIKKEHALYNIYVKDKTWPGNLNLLLTNLKTDVDNRGFDVLPLEDTDDNKIFAHRRMSCRQECQGVSNCKFCPNIFELINKIQYYAEKAYNTK